MQVNVKNGTRAGWRSVRFQHRADWTCAGCHARNRYYWRRCPVCGHPRPEED